MIARENIEVLY